jgi:hypothetical protein
MSDLIGLNLIVSNLAISIWTSHFFFNYWISVGQFVIIEAAAHF